ncbi:polymorphic toxin-type HINT domain-containing protein [Streptosporangium sp. NPDC050855]|uniref:polymorphic toxin-type HINT domain-containing protein n=1 Tax=Streptosporangium sp. NPDC050855 TaxID=3366194 RepID=UPI0037A70970
MAVWAMVLMPGLLLFQAFPVSASTLTALLQEEPETPKQLSGSAAGLASLVDSSVTTSPVTVRAPGHKIGLPKQALPVDERFVPKGSRTSASDGKSPTGSVSGELRKSMRPTAAVSSLLDELQVEDMWPLSGQQVGTVTPTLVAHASAGTSPLRYAFTVCVLPEEEDEEPGLDCSMTTTAAYSGQLPEGVNSWKVPAGSLEWGKSYSWSVRVYDDDGNNVRSPEYSFVTGARQPTIASQLAARGVNGQEFHQLAGNYTTEVVDASVPGAGLGLSVRRAYNSKDARTDGIFGAGWSTRFDMKIQPEASGALLVTYPTGQVLRFAPRGDGGFQPPPGMFATLATTGAGGWRLMDKSSTSYLFNSFGRLVKVTDSRGRAQDLVYGTDGKLSAVHDSGGRSLTFTWNGARVAGVSTDPVNGASLTWAYTYQGSRLHQVCSPLGASSCTTYDYTTGSTYPGVVQDDEPVGYWRVGEPVTQPPPPTPDPVCTIVPEFCQPPTTKGANLGWGSGPATYEAMSLAEPGALAGSTNTSAKLTGNGRMDLPEHLLPRMAGSLSMETWFKTTSPGVIAYASDTYLQLDQQGWFLGSGQPLLYVGTDGKLRGQFGVTGSGGTPVISPITSAAAVNNGAWHHVALSGSGNSQTLYLDGAPVGSLSGTINHQGWKFTTIGNGRITSAWPSSPTISGGASTSWGLSGHVDEVAVYDRPLAATEVAEHYAARQTVPHLLSKITLPSGRIWTDNTYDTATDRLKTHTDQHGGTWKLAEPHYDNATGLSTVKVTDPKNETLTFEHDAWRGYRLVTRIDQLNKKTSYTYDRGGYPSMVTDPNSNALVTTHDKRGNTLTRTTCLIEEPSSWSPGLNCALGLGPQERYTYYRNTTDEFDPRNDQLLTYRDARSTSATDNTYVTKWEYNQYGEALKETTPTTPDFPAGRSTSSTYTDGTEPAVGGGTTPAGLVKSSKDARLNETTYRYNAAGDLAEQTSPSGVVLKFGYDAVGRVTSRTQVSQAHPAGVVSTFSYDGVGRLLTQTDPGVKNEVTNVTHTAKVTYAYTADGDLLSETLSDLTGGDATRTTSYTYDANGRLETVTGPEGAVSRSAWDVTGARVSATDPLGTVLTYGYSKRGELTSTTIKDWTGSPVAPQAAQDVVLESYSYDPGGRVAGRNVEGRKTSYTYFADNRLSQVIADDVRLNGLITTTDVVLEDNTYDAAGNLTKQVTAAPAGQHTSGEKVTVDHVYDAASRLTSTTFDPVTLKRKTVFAYDAAGNVTKETFTGAGSSRTESTAYAYNVLNQITQHTIENGAEDLVSTSLYDDRGLLSSTIDPRGNASGTSAADFTTTMRYDLAGQLVEVKSPQVKIDKNGSVVDGRPTTRYGYDSAGRATHAVDAEERTITTAFDKAGRMTSITSPSYTPPGSSALTPTRRYDYDAAGQLTTFTDERGYVTTTTYDALGRAVRVTDPGPSGPGGNWVSEYNMLGEKLAEIDPTGARTQATYDDLGRQVTATQIERKPTTAAHITTLTYDAAGNLTKRVAPGNKTTTYKVNAAGQITSITDPLTHTSTFAYDIMGRTTKVTDPLTNATEAEYDLAGRQIGVKDLDGATNTTARTFGFGYDAADNPTSTTSGEGRITRRTFDATNQMTSLIEPIADGTSITSTFGYDATGARTRTTDGRGNATWTGYNSLGLVESVIEPSTSAHPNAVDRTWTSIYDAAGNATATLQPGGVRIDRTFDHLGRLATQTGAGASVSTPARAFTYDNAGRVTSVGDYTLEYNDRSLLTKVSKATNQVAAYAYDAAGNTTQRIDPAGTATYTWDGADRLESASDPVTGRTWTYGYDNADRLKTKTSTAPVNTQTYDYDALNRPTAQAIKNSSGTQLAKIVYGWDKDDNLTTKTTTGTAGAGTNTYGYDHSGRLTSWTAPGGATTAYTWDASGNRTGAGSDTFVYDQRNRLISGAGTDYTYTPRGTTATETKAGATRTLAFDAFDRLVSDGEATYGYDALGRMTSRTKGAEQRRFVYSGLDNDITTITDGANTLLAAYGRGPSGNLLSLKEGAGPALATMSDLHDDMVATFSGTALVDSTAYDPFGKPTHRSGATRALGYQGEYTDPDTGKVNMHARWYQPGTGAFSSRDDWTLEPQPSVQANRYTYANASPLVSTDPTGHSPCYNETRAKAGQVPGMTGYAYPVDPGGGGCDVNKPKIPGNRPSGSATISHKQGSAPIKPSSGNKNRSPRPTPPTPKPPAPNPPKKDKDKDKGKDPKKKKPNSPGSKRPKPKVPQEPESIVINTVDSYDDGSSSGTDWDNPNSGPDHDTTPVDYTPPISTTPLPPAEPPLPPSIPEGDFWDRFGGFMDGLFPAEDSITCRLYGLDCGPRYGDSNTEAFKEGKAYASKGPCDSYVNDTQAYAMCLNVYTLSPGGGARLGVAKGTGPGVPKTGKPATPPCKGNSFVPGTFVLMADGSKKPIEDVKVGDYVLATDPQTNRTEARAVTALIVGEGIKNLVKITVDTGGYRDDATAPITATDKHPFWVPSLRKWANASELRPGLWLQTSAGTHVQVTAIKKWTTTRRVHNFTVDGIHTYHVLAGDQAVLVHNSGPCGFDLDAASASGVLPDRGGYKRSGRALQKHAGRNGNTNGWPTPPGRQNADAWNKTGQGMLDDILTNPGTTSVNTRGRVGGQWDDVVDMRLPDGRGARFTQAGEFVTFLD